MYTATKVFKWEMAHKLRDHDGLCKYIHGHSYMLEVTLQGNEGLDKTGFVLDFSILKEIVKPIVDHFDHSLALWILDPLNKAIQASSDARIAEMAHRTRSMKFNPTAENFAKYFYDEIEDKLAKHLAGVSRGENEVKVKKVRLYETATSWCEYDGEDYVSG